MEQLRSKKDLGGLLVESGLLSDDQLRAARRHQMQHEKSLGRVLVEMGLITEDAKLAFLHKKFQHEVVDLEKLDVPLEVLTRVSFAFAEKHRLVPLTISKGRLVVAMEDPTDISVLDAIKSETGLAPFPVIAPVSDIERALEKYPQAEDLPSGGVMHFHGAPPVWWRILHPLAFLTVMLAPLAAFWLAARYTDSFAPWILGFGQPFDIMLYLVLGWSAWAVLLWGVDAWLFGRREP